MCYRGLRASAVAWKRLRPRRRLRPDPRGTRAPGNANLLTKELCHTLCDHAAGIYRILTAMDSELLPAAARELPKLDEKLYLLVFAPPDSGTVQRAAAVR